MRALLYAAICALATASASVRGSGGDLEVLQAVDFKEQDKPYYKSFCGTGAQNAKHR